jgi:hypothetical protein
MGGEKGEAPPVPPILGAWNYTSDDEKRRQWAATRVWAAERGLLDVLVTD